MQPMCFCLVVVHHQKHNLARFAVQSCKPKQNDVLSTALLTCMDRTCTACKMQHTLCSSALSAMSVASDIVTCR